MFYVCEQKGDKFGVKDMRDGTVEYYTSDELDNIKKDSGVLIYGGFRNKSTGIRGYRVVELEEYQELKWNDLIIFSFYNKANKCIYTGVETDDRTKVLYSAHFDGYIDSDKSYKSYSKHRNGDLDCIFMEGRENKCVGYCIWLEYGHFDDGDVDPITAEFYLEYRPDGKIYEIHCADWNFEECGDEFYYNSEEDRIDIRFVH